MRRILAILTSLVVPAGGAFGDGDWQTLAGGTPPEARSGHTMVGYEDGSAMIFGGEGASGELFNDLSEFQNGTWQEVVPNNTSPEPRKDHQAWVDGQKMYVYGGEGASGSLLDDLWSYDRGTKNWSEIAQPTYRPVARRGHSAVRHADGTTIILGGVDAIGTPLADTWRYNTDNTFTRLANAPSALSYVSVELVGDHLLVFGVPGYIPVYEFSTGSWMIVPDGPQIHGHASSVQLTNILGQNVIYIFGGYDDQGAESDIVYEHNLSTGVLTSRTQRMPFPLVDSSAARLGDSALTATALRPDSRATTVIGDMTTILFGGLSNNTPVSSTLAFNPDIFADDFESGGLSLWSSAAP